jgi:hypothetical protein
VVSSDEEEEMPRDLSDGELAKVVGSLLEIDETGSLQSERARRLVEIAAKAAGELETGCPITAMVDGRVVRCGREAGHGGSCSFRSPAHTGAREVPAESDLGSLDEILEWVPDPAPIREEILEILARLTKLTDLDRVAELVGKLAALVDAPAGTKKI